MSTNTKRPAIVRSQPTLRDLVDKRLNKVRYADLAKQIGIDKGTFSRILNGHQKGVANSTSLRLQTLLGIDRGALERALKATVKNAAL